MPCPKKNFLYPLVRALLSITHLLISTASVSVALGTADPAVLGAGAIASQLPDLDKSDSFMGRIIPPLSIWIEQKYAHRTVTHSLISTLALAIALIPVGFLWSWQGYGAILIGQFMGWFSDCFTKAGVAAFYPSPLRLVIPSNPHLRLKSGSTNEYWVMGVTALVLVASVNLASSGGVTEQFARSFFRDAATAAQLFQRYGAERVITVEVEGMHMVTSQAIAQTYTVIETTANDLIAEDISNHRLYKIGTAPDVQIRPSSVRTTVGDPLVIVAQEYHIEEVGVLDLVRQLPAEAYVSGALILDDMAELYIPTEIEAFPTLRVFGGQVELRSARPEEIVTILGDYWVRRGKIICKSRNFFNDRETFSSFPSNLAGDRPGGERLFSGGFSGRTPAPSGDHRQYHAGSAAVGVAADLEPSQRPAGGGGRSR